MQSLLIKGDLSHMINGKSCVRAPVLLELLRLLGKTDKMLGKHLEDARQASWSFSLAFNNA